jgi:tetratricopeptide (TPR) repeat protein
MEGSTGTWFIYFPLSGDLQKLRGRVVYCVIGAGDSQDANFLYRYMEVAMSSCISKNVLLVIANAALAGSLLLAAAGCGDALIYAKETRSQGMALYNDGSYGDAAATFANATRQDPRDYRSYYYMGASYEAQQAYQQAISAYRSCLDVMPLTLEGKNNIAFRYHTIDSLATVISKSSTHSDETVALERKCKSRPSVEDGWLLAKVYRYVGDADAAIDAYINVVLIAPDNFTIAKEAGLYESELGQTNRATFALKKAYAVNPDDPEVNDALRKLGVVGSFGRANETDLSQPPMPMSQGAAWDANPRPAVGESATVQTPRD